MTIVLASASARRQELLKAMGLDFVIMASDINEKELEKKYREPEKLVKAIAIAKAKVVSRQLSAANYLIIAADTMIVFQDKIIGKPKSRQDAADILTRLRNREHKVITGLVVQNKRKKKATTDISSVFFNNFSNQQMNEYLDTGVYTDRAGAYGIQDPKCGFVERYEGSYNNILGLPTEKLLVLLNSFGINKY